MSENNCVFPLSGMVESVNTFEAKDGKKKFSHVVIVKPKDEYGNRSKFLVNSDRQFGVKGELVEVDIEVSGYINEGKYEKNGVVNTFRTQKAYFNEVIS